MMTYDTTTALIVVDMQNDFADPAGSLFVEGGDHLISEVNREIIRATVAGAFVVYTQDWHPASTPHFEKDGGLWPVHCVAGEWGAEFHPRLIVAGPTIRKGVAGEDGYSGFVDRDAETGERTDTSLGALLEERSVERVVVLGLALDYCVKATALDAVGEGLWVTVLLAATRAVDLEQGDGDRAIAELEAAGVRVVA